MVQIKFIRQGSNSMLGGFSSGDRARVSEALAAHLVNEAGVAIYYEPHLEEHTVVSQPASEAPPVKKRRRAKRG